jgi:hypothetical protein
MSAEDLHPASQEPRKNLFLRILDLVIRFRVIGFFVLLILVLAVLSYLLTGYAYHPLMRADINSCLVPPPYNGDEKKALDVLSKSGRIIERSKPDGIFIVIDRIHNRLYLRKGDEVLLTAVVSTGAGSILEDPVKNRSWVFDTPIGEFKVIGKRRNPVWIKPDWEFIESKEPIPRDGSGRAEAGVLGEYALDLSAPDYMIHGTLYTRLIGRNVTHGCIRVARDDLRILYKMVPVGAKVIIF